jgi:biotin synthase
MDIKPILQKDNLEKKEIISLLQADDAKDINIIFARAAEIRNEFMGNEIHLRGIIEFSNYCEQNCLYCGLRKSNEDLQRYRMNEEIILSIAKTINEKGIKTIVLQSGEDNNCSSEFISKIIRHIKLFDTAVTLSLGERNFNEYENWKEAGADRYLLKHETANPKLYSMYHQGQLLDERLKHLTFLKNLGYQVGSGNLIGLPFQTIEDIADDILLCKKMDVDMASFSPFIPSPDTPYRQKKTVDSKLILKTIAVARIVLKNVHIPATTALATLLPDGRKQGILAGANVIMPNFTPSVFSENYKIYPNKLNDLNIDRTLEELENLAFNLKMKISRSRGESLKLKSEVYSF